MFLSFIKLQVGGEAEFDVTIPQDWQDEAVRGLEVSFKVKVNEIFERKLPDLDDAFASQIIPGCGSMKECREFLLQNIQGGKEEAKQQALASVEHAFQNMCAGVDEVSEEAGDSALQSQVTALLLF